MSKLLFYDIETTGTDKTKHAIHQIAGIIEIDGYEVERFDLKVRPELVGEGLLEISPEALEACGVTEEQITTYPIATEVFKDFNKILGRYCDKYDKRDKIFLVGYNNMSFDNQFLRAWWRDSYFGSFFWPNSIDVMVLATQELMNERHLMANFQLATVAETLGVLPENARLHDAIVDVEITRDIYKKLIEK